MKKYRRMTYPDRLDIEKYYNSGVSYRAIARKLGFSASAIHYEVQRGLYEHLDGATWKTSLRYSATIAQDNAEWQATAKGTMIKLDKHYDYANLVSARIQAGESPDSIVGDLRVNQEWTVSTTTLYRYIDSGYIPGVTNKDLVIKRNRKHKKKKVRAAQAPKGIIIDRRPDHINARTTPGHWEMDTVIGKRSGKGEACLVLTERYTRFEVVHKLGSKTADEVVKSLRQIVSGFPFGTFQTITVDNGCEFQDYSAMKALTGEIYYCHPYSSCERGSNENANRIIRRYFPKRTSMRSVTQRDCDAVAHRINHMHRKILNYRTAADLFAEWQATLC